MLVVVGGHSRNIGRTSVVCGIVSGLREWMDGDQDYPSRPRLARGCCCAQRRALGGAGDGFGEVLGGGGGAGVLVADGGGSGWSGFASGAADRGRKRAYDCGVEQPAAVSEAGFVSHGGGRRGGGFQSDEPANSGSGGCFGGDVSGSAGLAGRGGGFIAGKPRFEALAPEYRSNEILNAIGLKNGAVPADIMHRRFK